jgi:hypothetical protein
MIIDIEAPIVAKHSLGGLSLGLKKEQLNELLVDSHPDCSFAGLESYAIGGGVVLLAFDRETSILVRLSALPGYKGSLFGKVGVGDSLASLSNSTQEKWQWNDWHEVYGCDAYPGLAVSVSSPQDKESGLIREISIFDASLTRLRFD